MLGNIGVKVFFDNIREGFLGKGFPGRKMLVFPPKN
jgi:hypothetical protein